MIKYFFSSLTRISDLAEEGFTPKTWDPDDWGTGDYVVGEVVGRAGELSRVELRSGRMMRRVSSSVAARMACLTLSVAGLKFTPSWLTGPISGAFINLKFGQSFHKDASAFFFFECRSRYLADQYDVRNDRLLKRFNRIDKSR